MILSDKINTIHQQEGKFIIVEDVKEFIKDDWEITKEFIKELLKGQYEDFAIELNLKKLKEKKDKLFREELCK